MDEEPKSRKRKLNSANYKRNVIKRARIEGTSYVNHKGVVRPGRATRSSCNCKKSCFDGFGEQERSSVLQHLHSMGTKNEQDIFLQGLITVCPVKRRRPRKVEQRHNSAAFKYHVMYNENKKNVCQKAFLSFYDLKEKQVRRLRFLLLKGETPKDMRGKHDNHRSLSSDVRMQVITHIKSFPQKESHYTGRTITYLDAKLNVKIMYELFKKEYPGITLSYQSYYDIFCTNFKLGFGQPQVDTCCTCEELKVKLKNPHLNEVAKRCAQAELQVHENKSKKFYFKIKQEREDHKNNQHTNVLAICFDFMQNWQLPNIPIQEIFYWRQLSVSVFNIHNIKSNHAKIYLYHEGEAKKSPDEVANCLLDYIRDDVPPHIDEIHIYSDNCGGQNKNHTLSRVLLALTDMGRFNKIVHYFPIRGHSFLPCDRDFSMVKRKLKAHDCYYTIHEITELIIGSGRPGKFIVKEVKTEEIVDFKHWWPEFYKKTCISKETMGRNTPKERKVHFGISSHHQYTYDRRYKGYIEAREFIDGLMVQTFELRRRNHIPDSFSSRRAYVQGFVPLKSVKHVDLTKVLTYVPEEYQQFYQEILGRPTVECNHDSDDDFA